MVKIGIIGGSGFYELLEDPREVKIATPYGSPSAPVQVGKLEGMEVAFIPRHGIGHTIPPHKVNYRANIWALHKLGVERIIGVNAVGSLQEEYKPGDIVFVDQFIDFTKKRDYTFYDGGKVYHVGFADPFCPEIRKVLIDSAKELGLQFKETGTYICIEGPRFSTRAESRMFRQFADIIGMTLVPEINLARELEICYANISMVTDYDVWAEKPVDTKEVLETMAKNIDNVKALLKLAVPRIPEKRDCPCSKALENAGI